MLMHQTMSCWFYWRCQQMWRWDFIWWHCFRVRGFNKRKTCSVWTYDQFYIVVALGELSAQSCHNEKPKDMKKLKAPKTRPSGRDHRLSQLEAERPVLNSDPRCCSLIQQGHLILFITGSLVYFVPSSAHNYSSIRGRSRPQMVQLKFHFNNLTCNIWKKKNIIKTFCKRLFCKSFALVFHLPIKFI